MRNKKRKKKEFEMKIAKLTFGTMLLSFLTNLVQLIKTLVD